MVEVWAPHVLLSVKTFDSFIYSDPANGGPGFVSRDRTCPVEYGVV